MAKPIRLGLVLEDEDAVEFWDNEKKPATEAQINLIKNARKIRHTIRLKK